MNLPAPPTSRRPRRALLWGALVLLLLVAQTLLVALTISYESSRLQDTADATALEAAAEVRHELLQAVQAVQGLALPQPTDEWSKVATEVLPRQAALLRLERRDASRRIVVAVEPAAAAPLFAQMPRSDLEVDAELACTTARRGSSPAFSRSYFVPMRAGLGQEVIDLCVPVNDASADGGYVVATFSLERLLAAALPAAQRSRWELSFVESDGARLARAGPTRGAAVYVAERLVDVPGTALQLRVDGTGGRPSLIPNLTTALVLGLSIALFGLLILLARDVRRRANAEHALAEALAFRQAMEDSLITGLRARDLQGRISYVNPAFCAMVGFAAHELRGAQPPQTPYWPPERVQEYLSRQPERLDYAVATRRASREGFETEFMRHNGERFPVMIYEAPLVDGRGEHTGWMSAVVDLSAQRRIEELARQQQDRLQASARLATVGEMASLLSHELNQPLAAIASYASGSLNLLAPQAPLHSGQDRQQLLQQALQRIEEQAERAGRVIKSVHDFVRRREHQPERVGADALIDAVLPLVRLQARKSGARIELEIVSPVPQVVGDRTMLEQVLLNLTRNGIQAMESQTPLAQRVLTLRVHSADALQVAFSVIDQGPGIAPEVAAQLFTPFFTTRAEGMGLGLSLCRTVIEQHGGELTHEAANADGSGTRFRFTLAAAP